MSNNNAVSVEQSSMACMHFTNAMSFRPEKFSGAGVQNYQKPTKFLPRRKSVSVSCAGSSLELPPSQPEIELEFIAVQTTHIQLNRSSLHFMFM